MAKEYAKRFYNSSAWRKARKAFISYRISIDGGMCQMCGEELGYIVDHIKEISIDNIGDANVTLNQDNFQYLCLVCHNKKTFGYDKDNEYMFDGNGMLIKKQK